MPKSSWRSTQLRVITWGIVICLIAGGFLRIIGLPSISGYSHYFLYGLPEATVQMLAQTGHRLMPFEGLDQVPIWCFYPEGYPITACPPA